MKLLLIGLLIISHATAKEIYKSQNEQGQITFSDQASEHAQKIQLHQAPYRYRHTVAKVYDGDTIVLKNGEHVRLLGINTPEIESRHRQNEIGGQEAKKLVTSEVKRKANLSRIRSTAT
jgi:endonuclease YncB( thermonuclease family)